MRAPLFLALVLALTAASEISALARSVSLGDRADPLDELEDPKCARGECRPFRPRPFEDDDPKLGRGLVPSAPPGRAGARLQLSYRFVTFSDPYGGGLPFHLVELDGYPVSRYFRLGISVSAGGATRYDAWLLEIGLSAGLQYPARVTPFLDLRMAAGVIAAKIVDHQVVSYAYRPTLEAGLDIFLSRRAHLTVAVGWSHPVYGGVDARLIEAAIAAKQAPRYDVHDFAFDTVTVRAGLGL